MLQTALQHLKIESLNDMQMAAGEAIQKSQDVILLSPTGSGKTLAFLLPMLPLLKQDVKGVQALIIVPSRELAIQTESVFRQMQSGFKVSAFYGGHSTQTERNSLDQPPTLLVGTPGRLAYHFNNQNIDGSSIHFLVMDEFDKSLESGFQNDISFILSHLPKIKRRILTSATTLDDIPEFTGLRKARELNYLKDTGEGKENLEMFIVKSVSKEKPETLVKLICHLGQQSGIVFCNHRDAVERLSILLKEMGIVHGIFHGKMEQDDREKALIKFRNGTHRLLISTDLAARGLDIPQIENIIHYQLPNSEDIFIHRNGRTARMNQSGKIWMLLSDDEKLPPFFDGSPQTFKPGKNLSLPEASPWCTIYLSAGKKDKISKMDIAGFFMQKGKLPKDDLGLIVILDYSAYAAVKTKSAKDLLNQIKNEKIKNKKVKIELAE